MSQPLKLVVEKFGPIVPTPLIAAAFRPHGNGFGRKTGWMRAVVASRIPVTRNALRRLKEQGYTKVRLVDYNDRELDFNIEELLND